MGRTSTWRILAIALLAIQGVTSAQAARRCDPPVAPPADDEGIICVLIARTWSGSAEDVRNIESIPVPASLRRAFDPTVDCRNVLPQSLTQWHLAFGSEPSTTAALAYLEQNVQPSMPVPAEYAPQLRRAWRAAQFDLNCARTIEQPAGVTYSAQWAYMDRSRPIARLREFIDARYNYLALAEDYLRAAEELRSARLLNMAEEYLRPMLESAQFLTPLETESPAAGLLHFNLDTFKTEDFQMRAAILRAGLTRSSEDIGHAEAIVRSFERPFYRDAGWDAYSDGDRFCDMGGSGRTDEEVLETECRNDDQLQERVTNYWINRATLDAISNLQDRDALELAMRLLELERLGSRAGRCCLRSTTEDEIRILRARAEYNARIFTASGNAPDDDDAGEAWSEALDDLQRAERLVPVSDAPRRFRRIAEAWLALWEQAARLDRPDQERPRVADAPDRQRYATYLRGLLANLDAIAVGARPGGS